MDGTTKTVLLAVLLAAACAKPAAPPPAPEPVPAPEPEAAVLAPDPNAPARVRALAGRYTLRTDLPRRQVRGRAANPATPLRLTAALAGSPDVLAGMSQQWVATVAIPGYGGVAQGRERAWWWPAAGDSVVLHIILPQGSRMQLRGAVRRGVIRGDVWVQSAQAAGSSYQLGTFTATRTR